jgi:hypothetical protein
MILDLIALIFIIVLSCVLCNSYISTQNCGLSHIIVGLSVMVFYKIVRFFKLKPIINSKFKMSKEPFDSDTANMAESLNAFLSNPNNLPTPNAISSMSDSQLKDYTDSLTELTKSINLLRTSSGSSDSSPSSLSSSNLSTLDLSAIQQAQNFELDYLTEQVTSAQNVLNAKAAADAAASYKPIKVFSSCVMSNADGSTTVERPVTSSSVSQPFADINPKLANIISNTISQTNQQTSSKSPLTINLKDFLDKLQKQ